ncbi:hypothetical protein [Dyadobacter sp. LHD-138]|uniref:hypothetical protein n=1 Tax=Dyadobacter sp. LHD-138 TaxID=3071413 RepID=UPI0027E0EE0A|nr:hypothetical protein [Dyadobacter sp. LHD-138]MDQ6479012.1 hypothetical protein [Dyadobacter sp. LHD-138]
MKQVILNVPENQFAFFMKLVHSLNFVQVQEPVKSEDGLTEMQKETWKNIKTGFEEMKMVEEGSINVRPVQFLLNELGE